MGNAVGNPGDSSVSGGIQGTAPVDSRDPSSVGRDGNRGPSVGIIDGFYPIRSEICRYAKWARLQPMIAKHNPTGSQSAAIRRAGDREPFRIKHRWITGLLPVQP